MDLNNIKKALYKGRPRAFFVGVNKSGIIYEAILSGIENEDREIIRFLVPLNDIGDATFEPYMDTPLLIRYIIK